MKQETMNKKIAILLSGGTIKLKDGGIVLISPKQEQHLFNTLHRDYGVQWMTIKKIAQGRLSIVCERLHKGNVIINATIETY